MKNEKIGKIMAIVMLAIMVISTLASLVLI
ncbi:MAG TPA: stressosome-associated protein Prli42 [Candidatus Faecisoma merdavium]|nr:stressosome-associated protein Prli42 [Candidatus Faecisoma merdavium]